MAKKYYWLKLHDKFLQSLEIKKLRKIAGGDTYIIIYLKMLLLSVKEEGVITFNGIENTLEEELALELDEDMDNIKITMAYLKKHNLMELIEDDKYMLPYAVQNIGQECASAERVRLFREKQRKKTLQCNSVVTACNTDIEIDIDIDIDTPLSPHGCEESVEKSGESLLVETATGETEKVSHSKTRNQRKRKGELTQEQRKKFDSFWQAYPNKKSLGQAELTFAKLNPDDELFGAIMTGVERAKKYDSRFQGKGRYIPYPSTWLNARGWEDNFEKGGLAYASANNRENNRSRHEFEPSTGFRS